MPRPVPPSSSPNGAGHSNLFVEADPGLAPQRPAPAVTVVPRRGRGLVIPVEAPTVTVTRSTQPRRDDPARFTRRTARARRLSATTREHAKRAEASAQGLLGQVLARRYGALITLAVLAGLLLALSWAGLALRDAIGACQRAQRQQAASAAELREEPSA